MCQCPVGLYLHFYNDKPFSKARFINCVNALSGFTFISTLAKSSPVFMRATESVFAYNYQNILIISIFRPFF